MTPDEMAIARKTLGLTQAEFAAAFHVSPRAVGGWEQGGRNNGYPGAVPRPLALLVRLALKYPAVRRELGIKS
jgi:transcriptional regulator with XRE-family HTH domain